LKRLVLQFITLYKRFLSPLLPSACIYEPTCSVYTYQAIETYGTARGLKMGMRRILRCHPLSTGGYDPVPPKEGA